MCQSILRSVQDLWHEQVQFVTFDKREVLCIMMQYVIELMYAF